MKNVFALPHWLINAFIAVILFIAVSSVKANTLVFASDRSTERLVNAAHLLEENKIPQIRSTAQLLKLPDSDLQKLIQETDNIFIIGIFSEAAEKLLHMQWSSTHSTQQRIIIHSDHRLLELHNDKLGGNFSELSTEQYKTLTTITNPGESKSDEQLQQQQQRWPQFAYWLQLQAYWEQGGDENIQQLLTLSAETPREERVPPQQKESIRYYTFRHETGKMHSVSSEQLQTDKVSQDNSARVLIIDHYSGDIGREKSLHAALCQRFVEQQCIVAVAAWGKASSDAVQTLMSLAKGHASVLIALQDFVIGGSTSNELVTEAFKASNIPVIKGIRLLEADITDYQLSVAGLPPDTVHYRISLPELQGISQPQVLSLGGSQRLDSQTGALLISSALLPKEIARFTARIKNWLALQQKENHEKKVALIYYNHPPGRHNIGADNLNVAASLWQILQQLQKSGYDLGDPAYLPKNEQALLTLIQEKGINLPEDKVALSEMSHSPEKLTSKEYSQWFATLPPAVTMEIEQGPLGRLYAIVLDGIKSLKTETDPLLLQKWQTSLEDQVNETTTSLRHALEGTQHRNKRRALALLEQLEQALRERITHPTNEESEKTSQTLVEAITELGIEGIRGWGEAPGKVMTWDGKILIPGLQFGNVFIGPQPPRGWELNEELLHANLSFPPPHQYLGFYHYLQDKFKADALIHLGRHSTYEFLPGKRTGLLTADYPAIIAGEIPGIYPYIIDGVGEGIQAKRRGLAVMIDHLTPPLATTELYDNLLELRQLVESAESTLDETTRKQAIQRLRIRIDELDFRDELEASMAEELLTRSITYEAVDDELLLHETGHYLTHLQEQFMPLGLHVFGRNWDQTSIDTMLSSMQQDNQLPVDTKTNLVQSPQREMAALMAALNGQFVNPGPGNDPIRTPEALPTGRNFHALDDSLIPTPLGMDTGAKMAHATQNKAIPAGEKEAVVLWASDTVRDEGAMIGFGLSLLGIEPIWNSRGYIKGLRRLPLDETKQPQRRDVLFTASGLFRDLYRRQMNLLNQAVLMALAASEDVIRKDYPALSVALDGALAPLADLPFEDKLPRNEALQQNQVAANWVIATRQRMQKMPALTEQKQGQLSTYRVFGTVSGSYGAGINRLTERSSSWQDRQQLSAVYLKRMGHAYTLENQTKTDSVMSEAIFRQQLSQVSHSYLGRASNLYGLLDNNDAFDYLGGLNMTVEQIRGKPPASQILKHTSADQISAESLQSALLDELRGRFLNRQWIQPLMKQGYAGARTIGSEFIEYLWGWQVTSPELIDDGVWETVKSVYLDDSLNLGLKEFWQQQHNAHVQNHIMAVMLVAIDKGFWKADAATEAQLAEAYTKGILTHGIPGSGHTHPNHPVYQRILQNLDPALAQQLNEFLDQHRLPEEESTTQPSRIQEVTLEKQDKRATSSAENKSPSSQLSPDESYLYGILLIMILIMGFGYLRARHRHF